MSYYLRSPDYLSLLDKVLVSLYGTSSTLFCSWNGFSLSYLFVLLPERNPACSQIRRSLRLGANFPIFIKLFKSTLPTLHIGPVLQKTNPPWSQNRIGNFQHVLPPQSTSGAIYTWLHDQKRGTEGSYCESWLDKPFIVEFKPGGVVSHSASMNAALWILAGP